MTALLDIFTTAQELNASFDTLHSEVHHWHHSCVSEPRDVQEEITVELWVQPVCSDGSWVNVEPCVLFFRAELLQCSCCCQCSAVSASLGTDSCYFPQLCLSQWNLLVPDVLRCLCSWSCSDWWGQCKGNFHLCCLLFENCFLTCLVVPQLHQAAVL